MKKIIFLLLFKLLCITGYAQLNIDSLRTAVAKMPNDTACIFMLLRLCDQSENIDVNTQFEIAKIAEAKYGTDKADSVAARIYTKITFAAFRQNNAPVCMKYLLKAKKIALDLKSESLLATVYSTAASLYAMNKNYVKAIETMEEALKHCNGNDAESISYKSINLSNLAYFYYLQSQTIDRNQLGQSDIYKSVLANSINYAKEGLAIAKIKNDNAEKLAVLNNLCLAYIEYGNLDSAAYYLDMSASIVKKMSTDLKLQSEYFFNKGKYLQTQKKYTDALKAFYQSLTLAQKMNYYEFIYMNYFAISKLHTETGEYEQALLYNNKYIELHDKILNEENFSNALSIENNYNNEEKEIEFVKTKADNRQKSTLNKILLGSAAALLFIGFLGYRNFKNKQKVSSQQQELQKQKITELEKDKQLLAIDAMLQGQEEERSRIAKDLHDGLGGMLSGTKLSFINMKENLVLTSENAVQFDKSLSMLDNTIADLRKVAHNLMPEALVKFGLQEAVRDFCNSIQASTNLKVVYQPLGDNRKLSNTAEVFTYRIIQELVNNAVKHANATQIIVQLTTNNNKVGIAVEDNGKGFDANTLANSKGAGMDNIKYRVQYFNGTIDTVTSVGNGTSVNIELVV
jgi:two-component system, NarL family, sensor kinase